MTQRIVEIEIETEEQPVARCSNCGSSDIYEARVRSAFWHGDRLVVVEDIPAVVCENCHEQYFDDSAIVVLDLLRGDGFPEEKARRELRVPVFSFSDRIASQGDA
ncbi:MAG: type II toxin-antitoxin system MqsA family antitoxin [Bradyrhizobiaceae bacterium]|nr:type II toxin-antitoxin system MqsA family antitoxin [Bradyrhizobiaceae bacterium]